MVSKRYFSRVSLVFSARANGSWPNLGGGGEEGVEGWNVW